MIAYRLTKKVGEYGSWDLDADTDEVYAEMITAEQKVLINGKEVWKPIAQHRDNHYLDCEVYAYVAADVMNVRSLQAAAGTEAIPKIEEDHTNTYRPKTFNPFGGRDD